MPEVIPTPRLILSTERKERSTILRLECGHDRSIGGNRFSFSNAVGPAHLMAGLEYPCCDGHCGKASQ